MTTGYYQEGKIVNGVNVGGGAFVPTDPTVKDPTVSEVYKNFSAPKPNNELDSAINTGASIYQGQATAPVNEGDIRAQTLARFQQEIDAVNSVYGEKLREAKTAGLSRLGSGAAIAARSGTAGSDFGAAQNDKIVAGNTDIENSIRAENLAKVQEIINGADTAATNEIAAKRKAQQEGLDSYIKYLGAKTERKTANLKSVADSLITQKLDPTQVDPAQLQKIADSYGVTVDELKNTYTTEKKAADEAAIKQAKDNQVNLTEGQATYQIQPDGSYKLVAKNPKTFNTAAGNTLTAAEAIRHGLPTSIAGLNENQVLQSLDSEAPPTWFIEKMATDLKLDPALISLLDPRSPLVTKTWNTYRDQVKTSYTATNDLTSQIESLVNVLSNPTQ